jgi:hypothetical protein
MKRRQRDDSEIVSARSQQQNHRRISAIQKVSNAQLSAFSLKSSAQIVMYARKGYPEKIVSK